MRPYQQQASDAAVSFFRSKSKGNGLIIAPTGAGKSILIADIARQLNGKVMVLQPSKELLEQNYAKLANYGINLLCLSQVERGGADNLCYHRQRG